MPETSNHFYGSHSVFEQAKKFAALQDYVTNGILDSMMWRLSGLPKRNHNAHLGAQSDCPKCIGKYCDC